MTDKKYIYDFKDYEKYTDIFSDGLIRMTNIIKKTTEHPRELLLILSAIGKLIENHIEVFNETISMMLKKHEIDISFIWRDEEDNL